MGIVPGTSPSGPPAGSQRRGTAGTACLSGPTSCGPASCWPSPGAGSAPSVADAPGPPWWTTLRPTGGTGSGLPTRPICNPCASPAMTARPPESRRKHGENQRQSDVVRRRLATSAPGRGQAHPGACARRRTQGQAIGLPALPPPKESFGRGCARPRGPSRVRKFPQSRFGGGGEGEVNHAEAG